MDRKIGIRLSDSITARFDTTLIESLTRPCRPKILVVTDGGLSFDPLSGFGLTRFLEAITIHAGVTTKPILTLGFRGVHNPLTVTIGPDTYTILQNYDFAGADGVTLARYDQVWMFGINGGAFTMTNAEVAALSTFMNGGGGVFATGDHQTLGRQMCGDLPRIRHMRDWANIPMGSEVPSIAVNRIDTVVNPGTGTGNLYEFEDQSDEIPQRIYPSYKVTGTTSSNWQATVHPLLMLPGAAATRNDNTGFSNDIDVMPDHPHESVCFDTPAGFLPGNYTVQAQNFAEYPVSVASAAVRIGAEIVAYAVSGGRSVWNGVWKPPVRPQMFGIISAYDGRLAVPYSGTVRPGRIVCDSTWHHYVNINLDGTQSGRTALGTGSGSSFVPGPALEMIYALYRNIVKWIQPANRIRCRWFWEVVAVRFHPMLIEELAGLPPKPSWDDVVAIGRTAEQVLALTEGVADLGETLAAVLGSNDQAAIGDFFVARKFEDTPVDTRELQLGILGATVIKAGEILPVGDYKASVKALQRGVEKNSNDLLGEVRRATTLGFDAQVKRAERTLTVYNDKKLRKAL